MKAKLYLLFALIGTLTGSSLFSQTATYDPTEIENSRALKDQQLADTESAILKSDQIETFKGLNYFPIDKSYVIPAQYIADESANEISLNTTNENKVGLVQVGIATFDYDGKTYSLAVFRNNNLPEFGDDKQQLFIPFTDQTTGKKTNVGGRYLPVEEPGADKIMVLDFNKAMNPYNAYNDLYEGIIPPPENTLLIEIMAGERKYEDR